MRLDCRGPTTSSSEPRARPLAGKPPSPSRPRCRHAAARDPAARAATRAVAPARAGAVRRVLESPPRSNSPQTPPSTNQSNAAASSPAPPSGREPARATATAALPRWPAPRPPPDTPAGRESERRRQCPPPAPLPPPAAPRVPQGKCLARSGHRRAPRLALVVGPIQRPAAVPEAHPGHLLGNRLVPAQERLEKLPSQLQIVQHRNPPGVSNPEARPPRGLLASFPRGLSTAPLENLARKQPDFPPSTCVRSPGARQARMRPSRGPGIPCALFGCHAKCAASEPRNGLRAGFFGRHVADGASQPANPNNPSPFPVEHAPPFREVEPSGSRPSRLSPPGADFRGRFAVRSRRAIRTPEPVGG